MPSFCPPVQAANGDLSAEGTEPMKDGADAAKPVSPAPDAAGLGSARAPPQATTEAEAKADNGASTSATPQLPPTGQAAPASPDACPAPPQRPSGAVGMAGPPPWPPRIPSTLALSPPPRRLALAPPKPGAVAAATVREPARLQPATQPAAAPVADAMVTPAPPSPATGPASARTRTPPRQHPAPAPPPAAAPSQAAAEARPRPRHANPTWPAAHGPTPAQAAKPPPPSAPAPSHHDPKPATPARVDEAAKEGPQASATDGAKSSAASQLGLPAAQTRAVRQPAMLPARTPMAPCEDTAPAGAPPARERVPQRLAEHVVEARDAVPRAASLVTPAPRPSPEARAAPPAATPSPTPRAVLASTSALAKGAADQTLLRALPVPVFQPVPPREPAAPASTLPIWQEAPARAPPLWRPADDRGGQGRVVFRRVLKWSAMAALGLVLTLATLIVLYRWVNPPSSTLMLAQRAGGTTITQYWQPLEHISSNLQLAVIVSEDGRFCRHHGVDWEELESAIDQSVDGVARGGSTIAMQTVKNLFLWPAKSYLREAIEIPLAYAVDATWSKRRLLEIYLNIAEWGPGIFGAEAAARYHFRKPAALLTAREAALLAVSLPNPFERRAGAPGPGTQRLAANLMLRMRAAPGMARCVRSGSGL